MRKKYVLAISCSFVVSSGGTSPAHPQRPLSDLARVALAADPAQARNAVDALRAAGQAGLEAMLAVAPDLARLGRHRDALDRICAQKDCTASRLYWHTDFEAAKAAARVSGKPILSLRLLGRLDEELSCANSRFFRVSLYPNAEISRLLRERFILHWKSVRPVPRITIDFGDGRRIQRTITGNSLHYVLDAEGRPIDALPGLYGAKAFLRGLTNALSIAEKTRIPAATQREVLLRAYHRERYQALNAQWTADTRKVGLSSPPSLDGEIEEAVWRKVASLYLPDARLDRPSRMLLSRKFPSAFDSGRLAITKAIVEDPMLMQIGAFQRSMAEDTVRNEYRLHRQIHRWFTNGQVPLDVESLNRRVYAQLFLAPLDDPWLGLARPAGIDAIAGGGLISPPPVPGARGR